MSSLISVGADFLPERLKWFIRGDRVTELVNDFKGWPRRARLLNQGSAELIVEARRHGRTLWLFRSMIVAVPVLTFSFASWGRTSPVADVVMPVTLAGALLTVLLFVAHRRQYRTYYEFLAAAEKEIGGVGAREVGTSTPTSTNSKTGAA